MRKWLLSDHYLLEPRNSFFPLQDYDLLMTTVVSVAATLLDVSVVEKVDAEVVWGAVVCLNLMLTAVAEVFVVEEVVVAEAVVVVVEVVAL